MNSNLAPLSSLPPRIYTTRTRLAPLAGCEADELHELWSDRDVRRFLWDDTEIPDEQTQEILRENVRSFAERGFGLWGARDAAGELVGICGFWHFRDPPERELLYAVRRDRWGNGLAVELAAAVIAYAFSRLDFDTVVASTDAANRASVRVAEKLGMTRLTRALTDGPPTLFFESRRS